MLTWTESLFYIAFLGQILLISWYFPRRMLERMQFLLDRYPPTDYPKLYPRSMTYYQSARRRFLIANRAIMVIGFGILLALLFLIDHDSFADDGFISEAWPAFYGMFQFLPLVALEISECGHFRLMRKLNTDTHRTASLRPRRLFDAVSPSLLVAAIVLAAAAVLIDFSAHDFQVTWGHDSVNRAATLIVSNLLLAALGAWILKGRKLNPHQDFEDRERQVYVSLQSLLYVSMAMSVMFTIQAVDSLVGLAPLEATLVSLYFQFIAILSIGSVLHRIRLQAINFEVYRAG